MKTKEKKLNNIIEIDNNSPVENLEIGLYFHVPFCKSRCKYCSFVSSVYDEVAEEKYFSVMLKEIEKERKRLSSVIVKTMYFGGGTPSIVKVENIKRVIEKVKEYNSLSEVEEMTIEVNPCSVTEEKIAEYKKIGFNRISIGLQSANDNILKTLNRTHTRAEFISAMNIIKKYFNNFSIDLMVGLPGQKMGDLKSSVKFALSFNPKHISAYGLMLEEGTVLFSEYKQGALSIPQEETQLKMQKKLAKMLKRRGIKRYEVSNFAVAGYESKHNLNYWHGGNFLGFGAGAYSEFDSESITSNPDIKQYCSGKIKRTVEYKTQADIRTEKIMLGLRLKEGVPLELFNEDKKETLKNYEKMHYIKISKSKVAVTETGLPLLNQIIINLI